MSDIWNEFEKMAVDQGLISIAEDERKQEDPSKMPARYDSISDDAIRLLYGVEPQSIFDKDKTIIEIAHPETAVVSRTYDAMNAVVENLHQRQDMMAYIALKMPNGHLTQRRYVAAKADLVNSLVRSAFLLENRDELELVTLADSCTERLAKKGAAKALVKEALNPLAITGIVAGAGTLLGGVYYLLYGATTAQSVYINSQKVLEALDPLNDKPYASGIRTDVTNLMQMAQHVYDIKDQLSQVQSVDMAINAIQAESHQAKVKDINARIYEYINQLRKVYQVIPDWVSKIKMAHNTDTEGESDWWAKLTGLADPFYNTDDETLIDNLYGQSGWFGGGQTGGLYEAIKNDIQKMGAAIQAGQRQVEQRIPEYNAQQYIIQQQSQLPQAIPAPEPTSPGVARPYPEQQPQQVAVQQPSTTTGFGGLPIW
jgi:hypothetical protein